MDLLADYAAVMGAATATLDREACDWPELRREILSRGGIGPSPDWPRDWYPGDLYRASGRPPDMVAAETFIGRADRPPWQVGDLEGDDSAMFAYLRRSWEEYQRASERVRGTVKHRAPVTTAAAPATRASGTRSFVELIAELKRKHGDAVDLSGLRSEYVGAYETGERVTVERDGRTYRGTIGATRSARPRFVLLLSIDL